MTKQEFDNQAWSAGMKCIYKNSEYKIISVNFEERLFAIECVDDDEIWVRCENIKLIK